METLCNEIAEENELHNDFENISTNHEKAEKDVTSDEDEVGFVGMINCILYSTINSCTVFLKHRT